LKPADAVSTVIPEGRSFWTFEESCGFDWIFCAIGFGAVLVLVPSVAAPPDVVPALDPLFVVLLPLLVVVPVPLVVLPLAVVAGPPAAGVPEVGVVDADLDERPWPLAAVVPFGLPCLVDFGPPWVAGARPCVAAGPCAAAPCVMGAPCVAADGP
jgi:hypothetical protein